VNTLVSSLAGICRAHVIDEKWLIAPSRRVAHQWLDQVTRAGVPVVNVRVETTRSLAIRLLAPQLAGGRPAVLGGAAARLLVAAAWQRVVAAGGYLAATAMTPRLLALAERTLLDLRLAGLRPEDVAADRFEPESKGRDLRALLAAYERELAERGYLDIADVMRMAAAALRGDRSAVTSAIRIVPEGLRQSALERGFMESMGQAGLVTLPADPPAGGPVPPEAGSDRALLAWIDRPAEAPPPKRDGSVQIGRAVGEVNEVRAALRACVAGGIPLDDAELLHSAAETYVPLVYDVALRVFGFDAALDLGVPVTFADGVPARLARPGRLLRAWLGWIREGFPQSDLVQMLAARLLRTPVDEEGDPVGAARLVRSLRSLGIGLGRERYAACIGDRLDGLDRLLAEGGGGDEDGAPRDPESIARQRAAMQALAGIVNALLESSPPWDAPPAHLVACALCVIRDHARIGGGLDGLARQRLLQELESMDRAIAAGGAPEGFDAWEWLAELPDRLRVGGSAPRPGHLHVSSLASGGHTGRAHTFILGLDDGRFPSGGHQDPLVLDGERRRLAEDLPLAADRQRRQMGELAQLLARLRGRVALSYSCRNLDDDSETFASPAVLSAWRIASGERDGDHGALRRALRAPASFAPARAEECLDPGEWWLWAACREPRVRNYAALGDAAFPHLERGRIAAAARASDDFTVYDGFVERPGPELDPTRDEGPVVSATSRLQVLGTCPLRYFYKEVLRIRPPDDVEVDPLRWLTHLDYGTLLHEVLYDFVGELIEAGTWPPDPALHRAAMERIVEQRAGEWKRRVPPPNVEAWRRQRRDLESAAEIFLSEQSRPRHAQRPAVPVYLEAALGARPGPRPTAIDRREPVTVELARGVSIRCNARIDRIDRRLGGPGEAPAFLVWDYKSGRSVQRWDPSDVFGRGRLVQHALYLEIAGIVLREHFGPQAAVDEFLFFFPAAAAHGRIVDYGRDIVGEGKAVIRRLCEVAARGAFLQTDDAKDCQWCDWRAACQAVRRDLEGAAAQSRRKLANAGNRVLEPFVELRVGP
jgi:hypothetical protein